MSNFIQLGEMVLILKIGKNEIKKLPHITKLVSPSRAARVPKGEKKELFIFNNWQNNITLTIR